MAQFLGRDQLESALHSSMVLSQSDIKGLEGELKVGDLLAKYLPDDTYVIAHPSIGKYDPDFLVISPRYGFRLLEVKNWSINNISNVYSNGAMKIASIDQTRNPLNQVKKHIDEFNGYLKSLKISTLGDFYKLVGFSVIHIGFNRSDIQQKTSNWNSMNREGFFRHHLFADQLNNNLDYLLEKATKYPIYDRRVMLSPTTLQQIVESVTISDEITNDNPKEVSNKLNKFDEELAELKNQFASIKSDNVEQVKEPISPSPVTTNQEKPTAEQTLGSRQRRGKQKKNKASFVPAIVLVAILGIGAAWLFLPSVKSDTTKPNEEVQTTKKGKEVSDDKDTQNAQETQKTPNTVNEQPVNSDTNEQDSTTESAVSNSTYTNVTDLTTNARLGDYVELEVTVQQFTYDQGSGTKFLILGDSQTQMDGVIFKGTDVPFISQGETYKFKGEFNEYKGKEELIISSVE
ncbi:NERD domain-containing protein [Priestia megaterium]|uniref:NERD domain-containing protein n=1 Tax=Priestia megaterium TaxID=1404 RepID=UPI0035DBEE20